MRTLCSLACAATVLLASGCASVTGGSSQTLSIQTRDAVGKEVAGASCELTNSKGRWTIVTPGTTTINRSNDDMHVLCSKGGMDPARAEVVSITKGAMYGNLLAGGIPGFVADHVTGAAYEYPTSLALIMGRTIRIEGPDDPAAIGVATLPTMEGLQAVSAPSAPPPASQPSPPEAIEARLKELRRLRDSGLITEDVYQDQQRRALGLR